MENDGSPTSVDSKTIVLDKLDAVKREHLDPKIIKETSAKSVGLALVYLFGVLIFGMLGTNAYMLHLIEDPRPEDLISVTSSAMESLTSVATAVFSPLLGFVLGYYFRKTEASQREDPKKS